MTTASLITVACASVMIASFQYVVVAMQVDFGFSSDSANALTFMPLAASLLVVFIAGSLADRWRPRPVLMCAICSFIAGAVLVAVAPNIGVVTLGRMLDGVGGVTMAIVAVSVINAEVTEPRSRAKVFSFYAAVTPAAFIVAPPVTALLVEHVGWRAGMLPAVTLGLLALLATVRFMPGKRDPYPQAQPRGSSPELVTPFLAGLALAGVGLGVTGLPVSSALSATSLLVAAGSLLTLIVLMHQLPSPTLNLRWCRGLGMPLLLAALVVAAMPNLFFYTNLLLQYRYGAALHVIALLLIITQVTAVGGSLLSGPVSARIGPAQAAALGLFICGALRMTTMFVTTDSPIWVPVVALAASSAPAAFLIGPITNSLLSRAPRDDSGVGASVNKATWTLGSVLGGALIGALTFGAFQSKLAELLSIDGMPLGQAQIIAEEIRNGAAVAQVAVNIAEPVARDDLLNQGMALTSAQVYAYSVMGLISGLITLGAAILMVLYVRRSRSVRDNDDKDRARPTR